MWCVLAVFVEEVAFRGGVPYASATAFLKFFYMECSTGIVRVCGGVNDAVAIEYSSL